MRHKIFQLSTLTLLTFACSPSAPGPADGAGGASTGSGGVSTGGSSTSSGGAGGAATGGSASGGASTGGTASGGASTGGTASEGASSGGAGTTGGADGTGGGDALAIAEDLQDLRVDDPCAGTPEVTVGATCDHSVPTGLGFHGVAAASVTGEEGTTYDVTFRVRGVVEPTNIVGGTRPDTETFSYMDLDWRTTPLTIGGAVPTEDADYAQWRIHVSNPDQEYFLNDYQRVGHYIFELDYEVTIPVAANATVTLDATDDNERQILNYEGYALDGIAGSTNHGQFVQLNVVAVSPQ
jgi:hypothetical protein